MKLKLKSSSASSSISLCSLIFVVFLFLKLAEVGAVASWSWWWVTSPLWIPAGLAISMLAVFLIMTIVFKVVIAPIVDWSNRRDRLRREMGE